MDGRTDRWTEAITISPTLFLKSVGITSFGHTILHITFTQGSKYGQPEKNVSSFLDILLIRTINILTSNELVKLTVL